MLSSSSTSCPAVLLEGGDGNKKKGKCNSCGKKMKYESGNNVCKSCANPGDLALESFMQEIKEVGSAAMEAGLISRTECQELEPFLILGLPGLVLLRCVVRTFDEEDFGANDINHLLNFLSMTYRNQGEGVMEVWGDDGNIYVYDESFDKATSAWLEAKGALEEAGFLCSDSEDEEEEGHSQKAGDQWWWWQVLCRRKGDDKAIEVSEYAIFEAWILFGERAETDGLQARAKHFLSAYDDLSQERKSAINRVASKIRSVALLISKAPCVQNRLMKVLGELGEVDQETCGNQCYERFASLYELKIDK